MRNPSLPEPRSVIEPSPDRATSSSYKDFLRLFTPILYMPRTTRSAQAAPMADGEISSQSESDDVALAAQGDEETSAMRAAKTRAKNRKKAEQEQLKDAKQVLAAPRSAKVKALKDAVWGSKKSSGTAEDDPRTPPGRHSAGKNRKRALSNPANTQVKEPKKKKSKPEVAPKTKGKGTSTAKRPILPRNTLDDDDDDESGKDPRHTPLPDKAVIVTTRKSGKRKTADSENDKDLVEHPKKKTIVPTKVSLSHATAQDAESEVEESDGSGSEYENSSSSEDEKTTSDEEGGSDEDIEGIPIEMVTRGSSASGSLPPDTPFHTDDEQSDPEDQETGRTTKATTSSNRKKEKSSRMNLEYERPRFQSPTIGEDSNGPSDTGGQDVAAVAGSVVHRRSRRDPATLLSWEQKFHESTRLVFDNRARVGMNSQSVVMKSFLTTAINEFKADMAFSRPTAKVEERFSRQFEMLLRCAKMLKQPHIASRLKTDEAYVRDLIVVPEHRLTKIRGDIKKGIVASVKEHYRLKPGPDCEKRVKELKSDLQYIYPGDVMKNTLKFNEPFDIPIIHSVLATHFFDGPKSLAARNRTLFKSSDPSKPAETEIPEGMLIVVLIIIYHCLNEWSTGCQAPAGDLQLSAVENEYKKIIGFVAELKDTHLTMYHRVMHQVFVKTCAIKDVDLSTEKTLHASALSKVIFDP